MELALLEKDIVVEEKKEKALQKKPSDGKKEVWKALDLESAKLLQSLSERVNDKRFSRKVKDTEVIGKGLLKIDSKDIEELQECTLSPNDKLQIAAEEYGKTHGAISTEAYLEKLLRGEIKVTEAKKARSNQ